MSTNKTVVNILVGEPKPCRLCGKPIRMCFIVRKDQTWVCDETADGVLNNHVCTGDPNTHLNPKLIVMGKSVACKYCGVQVRIVFIVKTGRYSSVDEPADLSSEILTGHVCTNPRGDSR